MEADQPRAYGVRERSAAQSPNQLAAEDLRLCGFTLVDGGYSEAEIDEIGKSFDRVHEQATTLHGGRDTLRHIDEHNTVRGMLAHDHLFLSLARNANVMAVCGDLLGPYFILNQQNGLVNPPVGEKYNQGAFHRDLPYQHFTSSRPLALNALFCIDDFTEQNGATLVLPATHKQEAFPSNPAVTKHSLQVTAKRGTFIVLDCMVYHSGGLNQTKIPRRAVNHVYTIPMFRQQIDLPSLLGDGYTDDPDVRRLLGHDVPTHRSVPEYYEERRRRLQT